MTKYRIRIFFFIFFLNMCPQASLAVTVTSDTIWKGEVKVTEDILVPKGVTLTIRPGTIIKIASAESTKTDPEYISPYTEITIRGRLLIEGDPQHMVEFSGDENRLGSWAGIVIDQGTADMKYFSVINAETAVQVFDGNLKIKGASLRENHYGLVVQGGNSEVSLDDTRIVRNDYGLFSMQGAKIIANNSVVNENRKRNRITSLSVKKNAQNVRFTEAPELPVGRHYNDEAFRGDVVWQGRVEVNGLIRVPQGSRLIILPGTIIEFLKKDTDRDGIGENGILIQGSIIAKGTRERPIVFRSAEKDKRMGDWDSINIMDSSDAQNVIENCRIEHAYRGLHFHFSNVAVYNSTITNCYRGIQFQESLVDLKGNYLADNKSGVQGRDSDISFTDNIVYNNYVGANFYRSTVSARGNRLLDNWKEGLRIREGVTSLQENLVDGNRQGLMLAEMFYGSFNNNVITNNVETGLSIKNADNLEVMGNVFSGNGLNGLNIQDSRADIKRNQISVNGERGIGIQSFSGVITENNIVQNGLYAVDLEGTGDAIAPANWFGGDEAAKVILDRRNDPSRGRVIDEKVRDLPFPFVWPLTFIDQNTSWHGKILVNKSLTVALGFELKVAPKTVVEFAHGTGLLVKGKMFAVGNQAEKIYFTSQEKKGASDWDEIQLEYATGSKIAHCVFEYATWGLHSHFTNLSVSDSHFTNNFGGMRFRSGPVEIKTTLFDKNSIGIRSYIGNAVIKENTITQNEVGIFVREKGGGLLITHNNFFLNSSYNIRVGDFNNEDVPAPDNWWGTSTPLMTFFDGRVEPGIGEVIADPIRLEPVKMSTGGPS